MSSQPTTVDESTWRPTRQATLISVLVTIAVTSLIAAWLDLLLPLATAWVAALSLAGGLWLATHSSWRVITQYLAGLLVAPLGLAATGGLAYAALSLSGTRFPQPTPAQGATAILEVVAQLIVVASLMLAVVGACVAIADLLTRASLRALSSVTYRTLVSPVLATTVLAAAAVIGTATLARQNQTVGSTVSDGLSVVTTYFLTPAAAAPQVASLVLLLFGTTATLGMALRALPIVALFGREHEAALHTIQGHLTKLTWGLILLIPIGVITDVLLRRPQFRSELSGSTYRLLIGATQLEPLRFLLAISIGVSLGLVVVSSVLKRLAQASAALSVARYSAALSGVTLTVVGVVVADPLVNTVQAFIVTSLPSTMAPTYRQLSGSVITFYGPATITLAALTAVLLSTAGMIAGFRLAMWIKLLPAKTVGPALSGAGLFVASAFGGVEALPGWVLFAGIIGSFVAWDSGHFAWQLGQEVGRHTPTRNTEAVHLAGTLAVGIVASAIAVAALTYATAISFIDPTTIPVALVGAAIAIFLLVFALRSATTA
ncbi:DUF7519 family protein [Halobacterium noricense]|uniref:DUF7519 family protein n=1 Tax=Halobacterium noricense TaxID=223182 RepID=UPI001E312A2B|nr:hypothetical protein [Halobacterium noricense]UHH26653.1 hypothetical protein LT974_06895 [Halobacterium noricense]